MKIVDIKSALIGKEYILRVVTDAGIDGYASIENVIFSKDVLAWFAKQVIGCDPTNPGDIMRRIRNVGGNKPWGKIVSAIEIACWDIAGKDAGVPTYKLLGGKVRDKVRVYCSRYRNDLLPWVRPEDLYDPLKRAENICKIHELGGFGLVKTAFGWHTTDYHRSFNAKNDFAFNTTAADTPHAPYVQNFGGSMMKKQGLDFWIDFVHTVRENVPKEVDLAFDCGPGWLPADALIFAKAVEDCNVAWLEDLITGDYIPYIAPQRYKDITWNTTTRIHTGEEIYLRENFTPLIEGHCVNVLGPDMNEAGGLAEMKFIAEYANLHGIGMAPHGIENGVIGMAAVTQLAATMPENFIACEYCPGEPLWWYDIVDGSEDGMVKDGYVNVPDRPGFGIEFRVDKAEKYLLPEDKDFFR